MSVYNDATLDQLKGQGVVVNRDVVYQLTAQDSVHKAIPGLRGLWPLNGGGPSRSSSVNRTRDISGFDNHLNFDALPIGLTLSGTPWLPCTLYNGSTQYHWATNAELNSSLRISGVEGIGWWGGQGGLTLGAWIRTNSLTSNQTIISKWFGGTNERSYLFRILTDGSLRVDVSGTGAGPIGSTTAGGLVSINTWYHVLMTYDPGNTLQAYVNGALELDFTTSIPASIHQNTSAVGLGALVTTNVPNATNLFSGYMHHAFVSQAFVPASIPFMLFEASKHLHGYS